MIVPLLVLVPFERFSETIDKSRVATTQILYQPAVFCPPWLAFSFSSMWDTLAMNILQHVCFIIVRTAQTISENHTSYHPSQKISMFRCPKSPYVHDFNNVGKNIFNISR